MLGVENIRANLDTTNKHIWEIPFAYDSYDEDNDSSEEESSSEDSEEEEDGDPKLVIHNNKDNKKIKLRLNHGLEFFITKEKDYLARI